MEKNNLDYITKVNDNALDKFYNAQNEARAFINKQILFISSGTIIFSLNTMINKEEIIKDALWLFILFIASTVSFLLSIGFVLISYKILEKMNSESFNLVADYNVQCKMDNIEKGFDNMKNNPIIENIKKDNKTYLLLNKLSLTLLFIGIILLSIIFIIYLFGIIQLKEI